MEGYFYKNKTWCARNVKWFYQVNCYNVKCIKGKKLIKIDCQSIYILQR